MDPRVLNGQPFALLLIGEDESGAEDWVVFGGTARWDGLELVVERLNAETPFVIANEWWPRVRATTDETREILMGASYVLPLRVGPLPDNADPADYLATGMQWPGNDDTFGEAEV